MSFFVGSNGGVRLCNFAAFSEMSINDYSLTEIWKSFEKYINLKKDKTSECYNCKYKKVCTNCPVMTYMEHQTDGLNILPVAQNCREAKNIYKILKENE